MPSSRPDWAKPSEPVPDLAERLRSGRSTIESAETIAAVVADPATRELEDWLDLAEDCELKALRNVVHLRREEAKRQGEKLKACR